VRTILVFEIEARANPAGIVVCSGVCILCSWHCWYTPLQSVHSIHLMRTENGWWSSCWITDDHAQYQCFVPLKQQTARTV